MEHNCKELSKENESLIMEAMEDILFYMVQKFGIYSEELEQVEFVARDGFAPFTDGGIIAGGYANASGLLDTGNVPSYAVETLEARQEEAEKEYLEEEDGATAEEDGCYEYVADFMGGVVFDCHAAYYGKGNEHGDYLTVGSVAFRCTYSSDEYGRGAEVLALVEIPMNELNARTITAAHEATRKALEL